MKRATVSADGETITVHIPLTFGNSSDWSRNVRAAGRCEIRLDGTEYRAVQPELADRDQARPVLHAAFGPVERVMFRMLGIRQYLLLRRADEAIAWARRALEHSSESGTDASYAMTMLVSGWALQGDLRAGEEEVAGRGEQGREQG